MILSAFVPTISNSLCATAELFLHEQRRRNPLHLCTDCTPIRSAASDLKAEERKPMFQFALERGLLRFKLKTPALAPLFQLPPQIGKRSIPYPICSHSLSILQPFCQFQPPDRTIVHIFSEAKNLNYMTTEHMPSVFPLLHPIPAE